MCDYILQKTKFWRWPVISNNANPKLYLSRELIFYVPMHMQSLSYVAFLPPMFLVPCH